MHAFDVLGDPVRRRIIEVIGDAGVAGVSAGEVVDVVGSEFGITQPAVSRHLRVLRDHGFATVRVDGPRRIYTIDGAGLRAADEWLARYRTFWTQRLDALETELRRGARRR